MPPDNLTKSPPSNVTDDIWGRFETGVRPGRERLSWFVLDRDDETAVLVAAEGIAGSWYNQRHTDVTWEESDLYSRLNSDTFTGMFSRYEIESMIPVDGCLLTLLTSEEAEKYFDSDHDRELAITKAAELSGTNINLMSKANNWDMKGYRSSWWWLRGDEGDKDVMAPIVTVDGEISEKEVNRPDGAIRPVIRVKVR